MKLTKAQQSAIGRRSRRKGKKRERDIAKLFRDATGLDWQTTRNSGRTDLPGDVYCKTEHVGICVEVKDRKNWSVRDILLGNKGYAAEYAKVRQTWTEHVREYPWLFVFSQTTEGLWLSASHGSLAEKAVTMEIDLIADSDAAISGPDGVLWWRIKAFKEGALNGLIRRSKA